MATDTEVFWHQSFAECKRGSGKYCVLMVLYIRVMMLHAHHTSIRFTAFGKDRACHGLVLTIDLLCIFESVTEGRGDNDIRIGVPSSTDGLLFFSPTRGTA